MSKIEYKKTNQCIIEVEPDNKIWINERTPDEQYRFCNNIADEIKRHVDDYGYIYVRPKCLYYIDKDEFDTLYDAIESRAIESNIIGDNIEPYYSIRYKRPSDDGVTTSSRADSFRELIEKAYNNPWEFTVTSNNDRLSEEQNALLQYAIKIGLENKTIK